MDSPVIYIGIDPGLSGAIGFIETPKGVYATHDMPTVPYGENGKRRVDYDTLANILRFASVAHAHVILERVSAMPGQGVTSMFAFGGAYHGAWGVCAALGLPVSLVPPQTWKRHYGLIGADKAASLELARRKYPDADLRLAKHNGRAEALLIAEWGRSCLKP